MKILDKTIHFFLALFMIILPIDSSLSGTIFTFSPANIFGAVLIILLLIRTIILNKISLNTLVLVIFIFILFSGISFLASNPFSLSSSLVLFTFSLLFLVFVINKDIIDKIFFSKWVLFSSAILILTYINSFSFSEYRFSLAFGNEVDPNYFASSLGLISATLLYQILKKRKILFILPYLVIILIVLESGSRGALLSMIVIALVQLFLNITKKNWLKYIIIIFVSFLVISYSLNFFNSDLINRFRLQNIQDGSGRLEIWKNYFHIFFELPIYKKILGVGISNSSVTYYQYFGYLKNTHNLYINVLIDFGLFGLVLMLIIQGMMLHRIIKSKNTLAISVYLALITSSMFLDMQITRYFWFVNIFSLGYIWCRRSGSSNYEK